MHRTILRWVIAALLLVAAALGCGGLQLNLKNTSVQKPSNVALYFSVEDNNGVGQPNLTAEAFRIYEDDKLISPFESKQTILNPENAVIRYTLLLVDLSGSITESNSLPTLTTAASSTAPLRLVEGSLPLRLARPLRPLCTEPGELLKPTMGISFLPPSKP